MWPIRDGKRHRVLSGIVLKEARDAKTALQQFNRHAASLLATIGQAEGRVVTVMSHCVDTPFVYAALLTFC